ncbi:probable tRNA (uracil-O(2)-)-methyltransferase [Stomoxys calcitrans]|uniref:tRNA (uracil-O(2)-)-methyltransferase n=1 Tax=Stomoxys calcitrans TaxID=35570 RepID=A0A1I8NPA3_STOCA|nr:probable tRNA (uracil-O(2)-)-methyltransferase [Stomoxys calcitrans]
MASTINREQFWSVISILLKNYHTINRTICACVIKRVEILSQTDEQVSVPTGMLFKHLQDISNNQDRACEGFVIDMKCLPKKQQNNIEAVGILDFRKDSFKFTFKSDDMDDFEVKFRNGDFSIENLNPLADTERSVRWFNYVLKPKLLKWVLSKGKNTETAGNNGSLCLVDIEKYNCLYKELKRKYSEKALQLWNEANESTDPLKFIYEDLAIAAYLITLWQASDLNNTSVEAFADLGCGNGLLVYILIEEGFKGYGFDVRSRKIWSYYSSNVAQYLYEQTIDPLNFNLPVDVNWIIGNHSDELSPWVPVLAAINNYRMNYFLLPCCAFEFSGNKFQRRNSSVSTYNDFITYTQNISMQCGFETEKDRLKIPSTKRMALIGRSRNYSSTMHLNKINDIKQFVCEEKQMHPNFTQDEIKLRGKVELVRNCTQIDEAVINNIVMKIFLLLLNGNSATANTSNEEWLVGCTLEMTKIAEKLGKEDLKQIKSECGGLKTLLRNKHEIFEIVKPDLVKIRRPQYKVANSHIPKTTKKRLCFFHENHPQGCPLSNEECTFLH